MLGCDNVAAGINKRKRTFRISDFQHDWYWQFLFVFIASGRNLQNLPNWLKGLKQHFKKQLNVWALASLSFSVGEYQVKCSEASQFFSQTPCGYLVGFPSLFLIWFIPQSQLVFAFRSVGVKACEKVLTAMHPR